jgi:hypothetical protein
MAVGLAHQAENSPDRKSHHHLLDMLAGKGQNLLLHHRKAQQARGI